MSSDKLRSVARSVRRGARRPGEYLVEKYRSDKHFRRVAHVVGASNLVAGTAAAQISEADGLVCGTGLGAVFALGLGGLMLYLLGDSVFQGTLAWKGMKAPNEQKKREGRERLGAAGTSFLGAFVPGVFGVLLDRLGIGAFSCIDWGALLGSSAGTAAALVPPVTTVMAALPF